MGRPSEHEVLMGCAELWAQRSTCSRLSVGCVLSRDGRIVSTGYNGAPEDMVHCRHEDGAPCELSVHAEANAVANAAYRGVSLAGSVCHVTHFPCASCAKLLVAAGVCAVYWAEDYRDTALAEKILAEAEVPAVRIGRPGVRTG